VDTDQKIILLDYQNNFIEIFGIVGKIMSNAAKNFAKKYSSNQFV